MKNFDATLDLAKFIGTVQVGTATGGSTTTVEDTNLVIGPEYVGGTYWITSGTYSGKFGKIIAVNTGKFTLDQTLAGAIIAGVTYSVAPLTSPLSELRAAVNHALYNYPVNKYDVTLVVDIDVDTYTLPTGVSDVRRVEMATDDVVPYGYMVLHHWQEIDGKLEIYGGIFECDDGLKLRLTYVGAHGEVADTASITAHPEYLRYAAAVHYWRNMIQNQHKDNPIVMDMLNEAKVLEAQYKVIAFKDQGKIQHKDTKFARF